MGERGALQEPPNFEFALASELLKIECFRTIDRMRLQGVLADEEVSLRLAALYEEIQKIQLIRIDERIVVRCCQPFSISVRSLDAIHLSSALAWREATKETLVFLTHDDRLGRAAQSLGFDVMGSELP